MDEGSIPQFQDNAYDIEVRPHMLDNTRLREATMHWWYKI
jgi:hypothetical protein